MTQDMTVSIRKAVEQGITARCADDDLLYAMCTEINDAYDGFDYDRYEQLLDVFTDEVDERNWLEDLCTDLRYLLDWLKC